MKREKGSSNGGDGVSVDDDIVDLQRARVSHVHVATMNVMGLEEALHVYLQKII